MGKRSRQRMTGLNDKKRVQRAIDYAFKKHEEEAERRKQKLRMFFALLSAVSAKDDKG